MADAEPHDTAPHDGADRDAAPPAVPAHPRAHRDVRLWWSAKGAAVAALVVVAGVALASVADGSTSGTHPAALAAADQHDDVLGRLLGGAGSGAATGAVSATATPTAVASAPATRAPKSTAPGRPAPTGHAVISGLAANGIPTVALNAYRVAAARMQAADPSCGIQWWLLAAIGREESDHGQFGGAVLHPDGTSTPEIIGPALDGHGNQYIPAPSNGVQLDGDATYTHALGPMQFIPQTWAAYGTDADGDGVADIFDINDAALSAARYLCAAGGDLTTLAGQERAVLAYNHSSTYLAQVLALANAYRTGVPVSGLPQGNLTGPLPPVSVTGPIPVVNPGPPTAVGGRHRLHHARPPAHRRHRRTPARHRHRHSGQPPRHTRSPHPTPSPTSSTPSVPVSSSPTSSPVTLPSLPTKLPTKLPLPSPSPTHRHGKHKHPSSSPSPTCVLNALGICI